MTDTSKTKWTKGPWHIGKYDKVLTADGEVLKVPGISLPMCGYTEAERAEHFANARLISKAPEMAELLKAITDLYNVGLPTYQKFVEEVEPFIRDGERLLKEIQP